MIFLEAQKLAITRLLAGVLEKLSVASFVVGMFQGNMSGYTAGFICLLGSGFLICLLELKA